MKRTFLIAALSFGTLFGFGTGFASLGWHHHRAHDAHRRAFEAHIADVCVEAARRAQPGQASPAHPPPSRDGW